MHYTSVARSICILQDYSLCCALLRLSSFAELNAKRPKMREYGKPAYHEEGNLCTATLLLHLLSFILSLYAGTGGAKCLLIK